MAKQTRRSISVKSTTEYRIRQYAEDHDISRSGFIEQLVKDQLGAASEEDRSAYKASQNSSKIGQSQPASDTSKTPQPKPRPRPAAKQEGDDEEPEEMKGYVNPHLTL